MPLLVAMTLSAVTMTSLPATSGPATARPICLVSTIERADSKLKPHIAPLGEMPPAKHLIAVLHTENGCEKPIVVSEEVGANRR